MVVPNPRSQFIVMVSPIFETHIFAEVPAPVPNRTMSNGTEQVGAVKYSQIVAENVSKNILHEETGMWLNQTVGSGNSDPEFGLGAVEGTLPNGTDATALVNKFPIVRSGTIPHGNTIHATGAWTDSGTVAPFSGGVQPFISVSNFQNDGANLQFLPLFADGSDPTALQAAYITQLEASLRNLGNPALTVQQFVDPIGFLNSQANNVIEVVSMAVSTANGGAVINIPFETNVVAPQNFICTFLIETINDSAVDSGGQDEHQTFFQLQYLQSIPLLFPNGFDGKPVIFPHYNLNTLIAI